jgi:hypothetical protein
VVATGDNASGQCNVSGWTGVVQVAGGYHHTVGLKSDGTVVAAGRNDSGQCEVGTWSGIVQVAAGSYHTVALKADGTVVATGQNTYGQCNVSTWRLAGIAADIKANASDSSVTVFPQGTLSITVTLDNLGSTDNADWWLTASTPFGLYFYTFAGWTANPQPAYQGPLFPLTSFEILNMPASALSAGTYTFFFGVDTVMDGSLTMGSAYYDLVQVNVVK